MKGFLLAASESNSLVGNSLSDSSYVLLNCVFSVVKHVSGVLAWGTPADQTWFGELADGTEEILYSVQIVSSSSVSGNGILGIDIFINEMAVFQFPLVARSGRIRKLVANLADSNNPNLLQLTDVPGGAEAFDLAAKFCYGINFEITTSNVALLRCAAEYLEMTESYGENNLVARTEAFLSEVVLQSLADSIAVLHNCENLLPHAEDLGIVSRCIEAAATKACR
jgi:hypothetical protein